LRTWLYSPPLHMPPGVLPPPVNPQRALGPTQSPRQS
jgi:hypothetical protein